MHALSNGRQLLHRIYLRAWKCNSSWLIKELVKVLTSKGSNHKWSINFHGLRYMGICEPYIYQEFHSYKVTFSLVLEF